ncbi:MAG: PTS glucose transporter subunit IIA, partial [Bdellovibrio sp. CG10_big_fil_rev_8_21_14_0_10_47_8]
MSRFSPAFSLLQRLGQSLMLPVSVLPAAGLVVALGRLCQGQQNANIQALGGLFYSGGLAIFEQLPVVFAIGVAIGFTGGAGAAALAALVGYFTTINVIKMASDIYHVELAINTGVFGGILVGLMTAALYNRYYQTQLMNVLGFFSGKRLIPILTVFASFFLGLVLTWTWPPIQEHIRTFGEHMAASDWGPAFYAAGKRLLIPLGLHHVYYQPFLFEFGSFTDAAGKIFHGDSTRYFAGDPTAGRFMAAEFPLMLFGLPAAALAIVLRASPKQRKAVAGVMLSAALTSIVTGITEPIEFTFIFVAPLLYVLHVVFAFFSGWLTAFFDIHLGYTFSASLIDFGLGFFNQKNGLLLFLVVGPLIAVIYFFSFYSLIGIFNFKTPGRDEGSDAESTGASNGGGNTSLNDLSIQVLEALGGAANIVQIDACITRLRLEVKDKTEVSRPELKRLGAAGVMDGPGGNLQVVFGTRSEMIKEIIKNKIKNTEPKESGLSLRSPLRGKVMALNQVPDETFADKVLGDGIAIDPSNGLVTSPVKGQVVQMFHTGHAVGLETAEGVQILIHVGIDTVKMKGEGFKALVKTGDEVQPGTPLIEFDLELVRKNA